MFWFWFFLFRDVRVLVLLCETGCCGLSKSVIHFVSIRRWFLFLFLFSLLFLFNSECVLLILWFEFWVERENSVVRDDRKSFEVGSQKGDYEVCSFLHSCYCLLCDYEFSRFVCCFWILEFSVWAECWGILFLYVREKEGVWFCSNWELYGILFVIVIFMELCKQFYSWSEMRTVWREQV